jgi:hypothetical protein
MTKYSDRLYTVTANSVPVVTGDAMAVKAQIFQARQAGMTAALRIHEIGTVQTGKLLREHWVELLETELTECARRAELERYHGAVYRDEARGRASEGVRSTTMAIDRSTYRYPIELESGEPYGEVYAHSFDEAVQQSTRVTRGGVWSQYVRGDGRIARVDFDGERCEAHEITGGKFEQMDVA